MKATGIVVDSKKTTTVCGEVKIPEYIYKELGLEIDTKFEIWVDKEKGHIILSAYL